jgi:hypothetical protein
MLLQKRRQFEYRKHVFEDEREMRDPLFESEWEVFVVKRDPETGEFVAKTVAADEAAELAKEPIPDKVSH